MKTDARAGCSGSSHDTSAAELSCAEAVPKWQIAPMCIQAQDVISSSSAEDASWHRPFALKAVTGATNTVASLCLRPRPAQTTSVSNRLASRALLGCSPAEPSCSSWS
jgi:hypothetical protein